MSDNLKILGGFLVICFLLFLVGMIWFDAMLMLKLLISDFIIIVLLVLIDTSQSKNN